MKLLLTPKQLCRFWYFANKRGPDDCWIWDGTIRKRSGSNKNICYGHFFVDGTNYLAHRISYGIHKEVTRLCILHECDNSMCVNPNHLEAGTRDKNNKDRVLRGRHVRVTFHLSDEDALSVQDLITTTSMTQQEIADHFNVQLNVIKHIAQKENYKHLWAMNV